MVLWEFDSAFPVGKSNPSDSPAPKRIRLWTSPENYTPCTPGVSFSSQAAHAVFALDDSQVIEQPSLPSRLCDAREKLLFSFSLYHEFSVVKRDHRLVLRLLIDKPTELCSCC